MVRLRTLVSVFAVLAAIGAGAAWAASGGSTATRPGVKTPSAPRATHHCPNMGAGAGYMRGGSPSL